MGKGFGAVLPIVVIRVIADLLVNRLLAVEIVGGLLGRGGRGCHGHQPINLSLRLLKLESAAAATHLHAEPVLQITVAGVIRQHLKISSQQIGRFGIKFREQAATAA